MDQTIHRANKPHGLDRSRRLLALICLSLLILVVTLLVYAWFSVLQQKDRYLFSQNLSSSQQLEISKILVSNDVSGDLDDERLLTDIGKLPWVDHVRIRYALDHKLIDIEEYMPIAIVNDRWFLSSSGKRKEIPNKKGYNYLVRYYFDILQQKTLLSKIQSLQRQLENIGLSVREISISPASNWSVMTDTAMSIHFGVGELTEKVKRLAKFLEVIEQKGQPVRLDLRNLLGIAVQYKKDSSAD